MEYLEDETLAHRLQKGALPLGQVLQYAIEIADALDKAHRRSGQGIAFAQEQSVDPPKRPCTQEIARAS